MLEELVHHRYELPAFSTLDRMAYRAREKSNNRYFSAITNQLTAHTRTLIDSLLKTATGESVSAWQMLKREPKRPTNKETRTYIQHIRRLQYLVEQLPKPDVPVPKLKQFRHLARALNAAEMAELGVLSRNRRKFRQPINVACPSPGRWGRPNSRVTSRHFDHGNASRMSRPDCSGLDGAD